MTTLASELLSLKKKGLLTEKGYRESLVALSIKPSSDRIARFIDLSLLVLGAALLLSGILFFFAFNWNGLHRFSKIALVAIPLTLSALFAIKQGLDRLSGKAALSFSVMLTGILLAVLGQIYQTGADTEQLFFGWAALIVPWLLVSNLAWLWIFWAILLNIGLSFFLYERLTIFGHFSENLFWVHFVLNLLFLTIWESLSPHFQWLSHRVYPRILFVFLSIPATAIGMFWWWGMRKDNLSHMIFLYIFWAILSFWFYQKRRRDLFPLSLLGVSLVIVTTSAFSKLLLDGHHFDTGSFLVLGMMIVGLTSGLTFWLRHISRAWQIEKMSSEKETHHE